MIAWDASVWIGQQARESIVTAVREGAGFDNWRINPVPPTLGDETRAFHECSRPKIRAGDNGGVRESTFAAPAEQIARSRSGRDNAAG